jgi:Sulfate permease family
VAHRLRFDALQAEAPRRRRSWPLFRSLAGYPRSWPRDDAIAGLLRLGFFANFVSEPVLKGFIIGLALTIIIGQVPKLPGIEVVAAL